MEEAAFDEWYTGSFHRLVGQIYLMCGDLFEAQDCVQEAFIRAWDRRGELERGRSPDAWVRTVARRLAISRWRHESRAGRTGDRSLQVASPEPSPDHVAIDRALAQLPQAQRVVLTLHYLCDLDVAEIARELGAPTGTVKARLSRGREALAQLLLVDTPTEVTK